MAGVARKRRLQRLLRTGFAGDEEDGEGGRFQGIQEGQLAPVDLQESLEKKMELEGHWRGGEQQERIAGNLGSGTAARGLPGRVAAIYGIVVVG